MKPRILVCGAGGFIGGHLVYRLKKDGYFVRGVDIKQPEFRDTVADEFVIGDLRVMQNAERVVDGMDWVFQLAADMGGIGYIGTVMASITRNNVTINTNMLHAAYRAGVQKYFFSSSACVYPSFRQDSPEKEALKESVAVPADPEAGYGWEKLFTEKMCEYYRHDYHMDTKVARFHNVYGPYGTYDGGREKAPAAISRKIARAHDGDPIEVWGDGTQTRTFLYVEDCVEGVVRLMRSTFSGPVNIGSEELISVNDLVDMIAEIAGKKIVKDHRLDKPIGVKGRCSDNTLIREKLNWEPRISLRKGMSATYDWVEEMVTCTVSE